MQEVNSLCTDSLALRAEYCATQYSQLGLVFSPNLQTIITAQMLSIEGMGIGIVTGKRGLGQFFQIYS